MEISTLAPVVPASGAANIAESKLAQNFNDFLTLLTTQLRYQDPLSPLEANEFVGQLVQFSQVEQSINTNKNLEKLLRLQEGSLTSVGIGYIGKTVETEGDLAALVDGKATFSYTLQASAKSTAIAIINEAGKAVATTAGETAPGRHDFVWNGLDANGDPLPEGIYRLVVAALNNDGEQIGASTTASGRVTGVENGANGLLLLFGNVKVPFEKIVSVHETPQPPAS